MPYTDEQVIILLAALPNVLDAGLAVTGWRRLPAYLRPLAMLTLVSLATELFCRLLWLLHVSNLFVLPIYESVELGLLVWLYAGALGSRWLRRWGGALVVGFAGLAGAEGLARLTGPVAVDNAARLLESVVVILLALSYYHASLRRPNTAAIWREPLFWVSTGLLLFFAGNFLIYTFINYAFYYHRPQTVHLWVVHAGFNALLHSTYAYSLWLSLRK